LKKEGRVSPAFVWCALASPRGFAGRPQPPLARYFVAAPPVAEPEALPPVVLLPEEPLLIESSPFLPLDFLAFLAFFDLPLALLLPESLSVMPVDPPVLAEPVAPVVAPPVVAVPVVPVALVPALAPALPDGAVEVEGAALVASPLDGAVVVCAAATPAVAANAAAMMVDSTLFMTRS
jgi:hypothetical protein